MQEVRGSNPRISTFRLQLIDKQRFIKVISGKLPNHYLNLFIMNVPNQLNLSIYPLDRDLSKRWFIKFKFRGKEYQRYGKLNHLATVKERMKLARKMCKEIHEEFADKPAPIAARAYKYLEENKEGWRKKTYQSYKSKLDVFFEFLGNREPNNAIIKEFFIGIQKNRHNKTYNGYLVFLKKVFKICGRSPELFEGLSKQKAYSTPARYFQSYQIKRLKKAIPRSICT